ncbi:MAG: choline dehydrogenase [Hyphomicrobiaceae bacterium TMED74]|nr:choline dehydrogenase [Filomicrobium sp.]RPG47367.1 MAG: choline dehydrogenase [Hyphomicrobiaceae bacterium TMED74]
MDTFDYVIVGAGSAGSVLANRLSEDEGVTVCVLEAGPPDTNPMIHIPAGFMKTFYDRSINWCYEQEPGPYTQGRRIYSPRGKTLGGSSSINGHIINRGQAEDFNQWAQIGNPGWSYADILPYFKRMERRIGPADEEYRGRDGYLPVTDAEVRHPLADAFIQGAVEHGIPINPDYNAGSQEGINYAQRAILDGRRVSAARAFLRPAMRRPNLEVRTEAHVINLEITDRRATGVRYMKDGAQGSEQTVHARREVILSGGAYNSPQLLLLSGVGPKAELERHGIEPVHILEGVGEGLQDHYTSRTVVRVKNMHTMNEKVRGFALAGEALKYAFGRKGILAMTPTLVYCFWHSGVTAERSDVQLTFTPASYMDGVKGKLEDEPGMTVPSWQQRPESRGYLRLKSSDPFDAPLIQTNYLSEELDRRIFVAGMRLARTLLKSNPLAPYYDYECYPGDDVQTNDEFLDAGTRRGQTTFHPGCTCRMGPAQNHLSVVDHELRVHGLKNLRVVDASVMPKMISANLNASTLMIAEKASDMISGRSAIEPEEIQAAQ